MASAPPIITLARRRHCVIAFAPMVALVNGAFAVCAPQSMTASATVLGECPDVYRLCQLCSMRSRLVAMLSGVGGTAFGASAAGAGSALMAVSGIAQLQAWTG